MSGRGGPSNPLSPTTAGRPDPFDPSAPLELADSVTLVANRLQGHLYPQPRARHRTCAGNGRPRHYLRRTKAGPFGEEQAISLDKLNGIGKGAALKTTSCRWRRGWTTSRPSNLDPESAQAVRQGRVVSGMPLPDGLFLAMTARFRWR
jgi:tRNA pseudouridine55 synthase